MLDRVNRRLLVATLFFFVVLLFAPVFFWTVEHARSDDVHSIGDAYGWSLRTLFENSSPYKLRTQFGFVSYWIVRVAGVSLVAFATATVASRFVAKMVAIDQSDDAVLVHCRTAGARFTVGADYAVMTTPFPVLRHVESSRRSRGSSSAPSASSTTTRRRRVPPVPAPVWETDDGITGGGSVTDLAVRNVSYPDHGRDTGRGVMLASYTGGEHAQRWGSLSPDDRILQALEDVSRIHPQAVADFEVGASKMWHDDEYAGGAFALFDPEQQTLLYDAIVAPEGRIHFAGEHASLSHAWIQGAIESGLRAAAEIHERACAAP